MYYDLENLLNVYEENVSDFLKILKYLYQTILFSLKFRQKTGNKSPKVTKIIKEK